MLQALRSTITDRTDELVKLQKALVFEQVEPPSLGDHEGELATFGIDFILEVCNNSIAELPQQAQEKIEQMARSTSDFCLSKCLSKCGDLTE
jgi:hypothetical protein